ncbi:hypothetical protein ACFY8B_22305 [Streptomyces sp. NPDC012751]|uniref:hypothetical protein n=1 Tax=Streptomyces sp. NPDC012751 TaxID=3364846 RepID=UPI0036C5A164
MTEHRPYPPIRSEEDLDDLPMVAYLETAGRRHQIRLEEGDDPVEVAGRFLERAPAENRFNLVTIQRFSLSVLPEPHIGPQCGAMDATENGVVRCELEAHSDGVHDAAVLLRDGAPAGVRYWSGKTTTGVAHD